MAEAIEKRRRILKLNIGRLREQMAVLNQKKTLDIENLNKLKTILADFRELKTKYKDDTNQLIGLLDENATDYTNKTNNLMKELREVSDVSHNEAVIKSFHKKLSMDDQRRSLIPTTPDLNKSFRASSTQPRLEKINVTSFDGNILSFPNFPRFVQKLNTP